MSNGKGDKPRNCFSPQFKENHEAIDWRPKMKIGVIAVGRDCADVMDEVLAPWIEIMSKYRIHICLLSASFKETESIGIPKTPDDATRLKIEEYATKYSGSFSSCIFTDYVTEAQVRERGRQILTAADVDADLIWLLDLSDEFYTVEQIEKIIKFIQTRNSIAWFRLSLKNYVFDKKTYLTDPFQPPRIWHVNCGKFKLAECSYDNDFVYQNIGTDGVVNSGSDQTIPTFVSDKAFASFTIPPSIAFIRHDTWLNNERSKMKVAYQNLHFAHGAGCSFGWNPAKGGLVWNENYFTKTRQVIPETQSENSE